MDLLTEAGSHEALLTVRTIQAACRMALRHCSDSEMSRLNEMLERLAELHTDLTAWLRAWETQ